MSQSLASIDFKQLIQTAYTASPTAWEDRVFYFILLDRFSDGQEAGFADEGTIPLYNPSDSGNAIKTAEDALVWRTAGAGWTGGTIRGIRSKIAYLSDMGVTALWISPVFKQVSFTPTYHGYGIQDFLEIDPHFGSLEDLRELVAALHGAGIAVILDIVLNHSGNVFSYDADRYPVVENGVQKMQPRWDGNPYRPKGFNNELGQPVIPFVADLPEEPGAQPGPQPNPQPDAPPGPNDAIWPKEFRETGIFTQKGPITNWDNDPEYLEGDFFDLKDIHLGQGEPDSFVPSPGLLHLVKVYKYWMALLDIDGYRVDTVKHMETGAVRYFAMAMHEFAQTLGKDQFLLVGEISGDRTFAFRKLQATGLDAALGIADVQDALGDMVKGKVAPEVYFELFRNSLQIGKGAHTWFRNKVVVMVDDHDKINQGDNKYRFCARDAGDLLIRNAIATNLMTLGIPCIYYGSEQRFDGSGAGVGADEYIREAMFGGAFGAFRSRERHFFDVSAPVYKEVALLTAIRRRHITLRRGRQYLRPISGDGIHFGLPDFVASANRISSIIAWSRLLDSEELVLAMNTDIEKELGVWVTLDNDLHGAGDLFTAIYPAEPPLPEAVVENRNGKAIFIRVPGAGFVIYKRAQA